MKKGLLIAWFWMCAVHIMAQGIVRGRVTDSLGAGVPQVEILAGSLDVSTYSASNGDFELTDIPFGQHMIMAYAEGFIVCRKEVELSIDQSAVELDFKMFPLAVDLEGVQVEDEFSVTEAFGISPMRKVENGAIYAGKKTEAISPDHMVVNSSTANARQTYAKIAGLNIWENDGVGLQLGIGGRGLNPNRVSNFNTRQNGYDISADALGYPESYYSPPIEAVQRIEILRGAASLQYGTQFGGMINYRLKNGDDVEGPFEFYAQHTIGSFGYYHYFNSVAGNSGNVSYYGYAHHKHGNGWRDNSQFDLNGAYGVVNWSVSEKLQMGFEHTYMGYLAQQPGGLTDYMFEQDPRQSVRSRNWFRVKWNLSAFTLDYEISPKSTLNARVFGLTASRDALGNRDAVSRLDHEAERDYLRSEFQNVGAELRWLRHLKIGGRPVVLLLGSRVYNGHTERMEGLGSSSELADFTFVDADSPTYSKYVFPSFNASGFAEGVIFVTDKFTLTPGLRYEWISTNADGFYNTRITDLAGNILLDQTTDDVRSNDRDFLLGGIGASYTHSSAIELYANVSQNYRSINFNDMRVANPNFRVDPDLKDETGYTLDIGQRGIVKDWLYYDVSFFHLCYNDRIGNVLQTDTIRYTSYRLRTNIADSKTTGVETFAEIDLLRALSDYNGDWRWSVFSNLAVMKSTYNSSDEKAFDGKQVELVPPVSWKTGLTVKYKGWCTALQFAYTGQHFTDATNAEFSADGVHGIIPSYYVMDWTTGYKWKNLKVSASLNNLTNNLYYTRRAAGYPGPGIIPSDGRAGYVTLGYQF